MSPSRFPRGSNPLLSFGLIGAAVAITVVAGCGSPNHTIPALSGTSTVPTPTPSPAVTSRTLTASSVSLGSNGTGVVTVIVKSDGTATGTLTLTQPAGTTVALSGTSVPGTGAFSLTGSFTPSGSAAVTATVTGTAPASGAASGGTCVVTVGANTATTSFSGSATPTPTPTPSTTPTPTPTPTSTPTGSVSLANGYIVNYAATDTRTYTDVVTTTIGSSAPTTSTSNITFTGGGLFTNDPVGKSTQVQLSTSSGTVTVTRQELLDSSGNVTGYNYFTQNSTSLTSYGADSLATAGSTVSTTTRYSPALVYDFTLTAGNSTSQTVQATTVTTDSSTNTSTTSTKTEAFAFKFLGTESVTVPAGTFSACAKVEADLTITTPASGSVPASTITLSETTWFSKTVGEVKASTNLQSGSGSTGFSSVTAESLISAFVGGKNYP